MFTWGRAGVGYSGCEGVYTIYTVSFRSFGGDNE